MTPGTTSDVVLYEPVNPDKRAGNWDTPPLPINHLGERHALTATFNADEARDFWGFICVESCRFAPRLWQKAVLYGRNFFLKYLADGKCL